MPYFPNYIQYNTLQRLIPLMSLQRTYLYNNSLSFWPFSLRFLSALKIPMYITILQPDLHPKIYMVSGLWSYLVAKSDFHGTIDF